MKRLAFFIIAVFCVVSCTYSNPITKTGSIGNPESELSSKQELEKVIPKLPHIARSRPKSIDTQLGIAFLYVNYGTPKGSHFKTSHELRTDSKATVQTQFDRVLAIDPNNKALWAIKSNWECTMISAEFFSCLDSMEMIKERFNKSNLAEFMLTQKKGLLFYWLREDNKDEKVVIKDIESAEDQLRKKFEKKAWPVFEILNQGQSIEPDNPVYNYLRAHLYLVAGKYEEAIMEIDEGVKKQSFHTYESELRKIAGGVLKSAGASRADIEEVVTSRTIFEDFLIRGVWEQGLSGLAEKYEKQKHYDKAEKIYKLAVLMAWQTHAEQDVPGVMGLDKAAFDRLVKLREKILRNSSRNLKLKQD